MSQEATPLRQVLLAYALLVSALAAAWFVVGQPLHEAMAQGEARIAALQVRIDALERAAAGDPALNPDLGRDQIEQLRRFIRAATIDAETLEVGGSLLRRRLTDIVEAHGGEPGNTGVVSNPDTATVMVSAQFVTDLPSLADILFELEKARPFMVVDLLSIRRRDRYLETGKTADEPGLLVQIEVSAFWSGPPADRVD